MPAQAGSSLTFGKLARLVVRTSLLLSVVCLSLAARAQVNVYTRSNDNARTGQNLQETILTPANVNAAGFGKLFTIHTDGQIYAQPLYVSNLAIAGGTHNVVFVASMLNTVYALDADTGATLWTQNFGSPIIPKDVETDGNIVWQTRLGILGTPVIDPATDYMYFVSGSQPADGSQQFAFNLNAIDIKTGLPVNGSPVQITATYTTPDLTAPLVFNAKIHNPRPGLALANGNVYIAFASHEDQNAYHGFVMAYSTATLAQTAVYSDTTIGYQGGIWSAGQAPSVDTAGNIYISTGNGSFGKTPNGLVQTGNSFIKLSPALQLLDYFTPTNSAVLNSGDQDLGSSGLLLIPNTTYAIGGGKQGVLYLVDTTALGGFNTSADQVKQEFQAVYGKGTSHIHGGPAYFNSDKNGPTIYNWGENDVLRAFSFNGTTVNTTPLAMGTLTAPQTNNDGAMPGGFLAISANGDDDGILWASTPYNGDAVHQSVQGVVYAYDAETLKLLWSDKDNESRDEIGTFAKYVPPVIANGKVYMATFGAVGTNDGSGALVVYGLIKPQLTVAVADASVKTGAALPVFTGTVTGLQSGDTVGTTVIVTYSTTATAASPAGTYPITATVTGTSAAAYQVVVNAGTLTIVTPPVLTATASNATRAFGAANPAFTGTITGAANGDTFTENFSTTATATSDVGSYPIVPAVTGTNVANYTVTPVNGTLTVTAATTTTALVAPGSATPGSATALTATVASTAGTPGGVVTFSSGAVTLGTATLNAGGMAVLSTTALPVGTDAVTAAYAATGNYAASTSAAASVVVSAASQTITFAAIPAQTYGSAPFPVTATSSLGSAYPVVITVQSGPATIGGGTVATTGVGTVVLLATQAGDSSHASANATQSFPVAPAPTSTALTAPSSAVVGTAVSLRAAVTSPAGSVTGTVTFSSGATVLGTGMLSSGVATLSTSALPQGADAITASFAAAGNYAASTSSAVTVTIAAPVPAAYSLTASSTALTMTKGTPASTTVTLAGTGGYNGTVALSCTGLPANAACVFDQAQVTLSDKSPTASVQLTIQSTTAQARSTERPPSTLAPALLALVFWCPGGLTGMLAFVRRGRVAGWQRLVLLCLLVLGSGALAAGLSGCGGGSMSAQPTTSQVTLVATGTAGSATTTQTLTLSVTSQR